MKRLFLLALCVLLAGCVSNPVHRGYKGQDAGVLIFSAGAIGAPLDVDFYYRKLGQPSGYRTTGGDGSISYNPRLLLRGTLDYTGHEMGKVHVEHLEPGDYEVYTWSLVGNGMVSELDLMPHRGDFSLPFTIKPGQATYVGNFAAVAIGGEGVPPGAIFYYVVSDKHERDIAIARQKEPNLPPVTIQVTDVSKLGEPSLLVKEPGP